MKCTSPGRRGDYWEYYVMLNAMKNGAEVFKNISSTGMYDIVLSLNGDTLPCDVKQLRWNTAANKYTYRGDARAKNVILVHPVTQKINWHCAPSGWENFWS